ncbi:LysR family transcriptional regulator [Brevundimonas sp.]|jgi:DNA-binding transcriptional LysR family regulator|uniref:LysR family transcriptional regulator n=1 Tax=Brevundimonas sp. TaxID=1871086 RepID=UPI0037BEDF27
MKRNELGDLIAFLAVAEAKSFTRAAARLGTSQSSLSETVRRLEERLDVRLLTRTTRTVAPTDAGRQLVETLRPALDGIKDQLLRLNETRNRPAGRLRITSSKYAALTILGPAVSRLLALYPSIQVEIDVNSSFVDIVRDGYDAGVRLGENIDKDMIAVPLSGDMRMAVVGAPAYFVERPIPKTPQELAGHLCINRRMSDTGALRLWEFSQNNRTVNAPVQGQLTTNDDDLVIRSCLAGDGLAFMLEGSVRGHVDDGRLVRVLEDWCPPFPGFHLYYPSRRQSSAAFRLLLDALRGRL